MPTERTTNREQVRKAIRKNWSVQIGDQYVNPDEIVLHETTSDPQFTHRFELANGTTVRHDTFQSGSIGDLVHEEIKKLSRERGRSEKLRPSWPNVLLRVSGGGSLEHVNVSNEVLRVFGNDDQSQGEALGAMDIEENLVVKVDGFSGTDPVTVKTWKYDDGSQRGSDTLNTDEFQRVDVSIGQDGQVYTAMRNTNGNLVVHRRNPDMSVADTIVSDGDAVTFGPGRLALAIDTAAGFALAAGNENRMLRVKLTDGTVSSYSNFGNISNDRWQSYRDPGNARWIMSAAGEVYELDRDDLQASEKLLQDFGSAIGGQFNTRPLVGFDPSSQTCLFLEHSDDEAFRASLDDGSVEDLGPLGEVVAGVLDLEA